MKKSNLLTINDKKIGEGHPAYFIADIGANHDGDIERAKDLIYLCAEAGADVCTCPLDSILGLLKHPLTDIGLAKFLEDAKKTQ